MTANVTIVSGVLRGAIVIPTGSVGTKKVRPMCLLLKIMQLFRGRSLSVPLLRLGRHKFSQVCLREMLFC